MNSSMIRFRPSSDTFSLLSDRFFNDLFTPTRGGEDRTNTWAPSTDIEETTEAFLIHADLPGLKKDHFEISVEDNVLELSGERKFEKREGGEKEGFRRIERSYGKFVRSFTLPRNVDSTKIEARFEDGVLTVSLPKSEGSRSRQISVS